MHGLLLASCTTLAIGDCQLGGRRMSLGKAHELFGLQCIQLLDALEGSFVNLTTSLMHLACAHHLSLGDDCL